MRGCQIFNEESSRKAIEYFAEQKIIEGEVLGKDKGDRVLAKSIARLFRQKAGDGEGKGLAMREVGEFLASGKPLSTMVRTEFANTYDFTGMSYTEALRGYLMSFRLPGESMLIERLLAVFSSRFYRDNPADFSHQLTKERVTELWAAFMKFSAKQRPGTKPDAAVVKVRCSLLSSLLSCLLTAPCSSPDLRAGRPGALARRRPAVLQGRLGRPGADAHDGAQGGGAHRAHVRRPRA